MPELVVCTADVGSYSAGVSCTHSPEHVIRVAVSQRRNVPELRKRKHRNCFVGYKVLAAAVKSAIGLQGLLWG
jgi:hypothetical protein